MRRGDIFGVGMVAAILVDATVIRMLLVPAVMHMLSTTNWWLPGTVARRLPSVHIEASPIAYTRPPATDQIQRQLFLHCLTESGLSQVSEARRDQIR